MKDRQLLKRQTVIIDGKTYALIPLANGTHAIVDLDLFESLNMHAWHSSSGYARRNSGTKAIFMHRQITNTPTGLTTDHINGNRLDNRRCNLRVATYSENLCNRRTPRHNTTGFKGLLFSKGIYRPRIQLRGQIFYCGSFKSAEEAATARARKLVQIHGEFANTGTK